LPQQLVVSLSTTKKLENYEHTPPPKTRARIPHYRIIARCHRVITAFGNSVDRPLPAWKSVA